MKHYDFILTFKKTITAIDGRPIIPKGSAYRQTFEEHPDSVKYNDYETRLRAPHLTAKIEAFECMIILDYWHGEFETKIGSVIELSPFDGTYFTATLIEISEWEMWRHKRLDVKNRESRMRE